MDVGDQERCKDKGLRRQKAIQKWIETFSSLKIPRWFDCNKL